MALDFPSSPQRDEAQNITTTNSTTTNNNRNKNNWLLGIPTITLSPSPDPQRMLPPPLSSSQDGFDYDSDSSSDSGVVQIYGFKSKQANDGDVAGVGVGVNVQEREIRTKNDLHPYVQTISLADLESCVALENAAFPEEERCSREKVCTVFTFFNFLYNPPSFFFEREKEKITCFFSFKSISPSSSTIFNIVLKQKCQENIALSVIFTYLHFRRHLFKFNRGKGFGPSQLTARSPLISHIYSSSTDSMPALTSLSACSLPFPRLTPLFRPYPQLAPLFLTNLSISPFSSHTSSPQ